MHMPTFRHLELCNDYWVYISLAFETDTKLMIHQACHRRGTQPTCRTMAKRLWSTPFFQVLSLFFTLCNRLSYCISVLCAGLPCIGGGPCIPMLLFLNSLTEFPIRLYLLLL
jgi:hypothetical protein